MNYIKHLTNVMIRFADDDRLNTAHVSLYLALFQLWNLNRFQNPISINRNEVMKISKIGSKGTYHRCINDLDSWKYLKYLPSHNPLKGSVINMFIFDTSTEQETIQLQGHQQVQASEHLINITKKENIQILPNDRNQYEIQKNENLDLKKGATVSKKNETSMPANLEEVEAYFSEKEKPISEANKFFNYYEANGWLVGQNKMKNWRAAANNWMLNAQKFNARSNQEEKINYLHVNQDKDYSIPL